MDDLGDPVDEDCESGHCSERKERLETIPVILLKLSKHHHGIVQEGLHGFNEPVNLFKPSIVRTYHRNNEVAA